MSVLFVVGDFIFCSEKLCTNGIVNTHMIVDLVLGQITKK